MADVNTRATARGNGGSTIMLGLLLIVVIAAVVWLVMRGSGQEADVDVNVPAVEAPETP